ncbi:MAG: helix-turn-helix transcriptional regulator [Clostridia bacterium]|nr:helix-turn-helix transcriptional regulator [Clostridia bacterium]
MDYIECKIPKSINVSGLYTAFKVQFEANYTFDGETHNFWELVIVLDGDIGVCAGNKILSLTKGDAFLHEPMEFHRIWSEHQTCPTVIIITFSAEMMPELNKRVFTLPEEELKSIESLHGTLEDAYDYNHFIVNGIKENCSIKAELFVKKFEIFLLQAIYKYQKKTYESEINRTKSALSYTSIVRFLESNIGLNLSIDEIAAGCNMSRSNLKKTFAKYAGLGIMKYFMMLKMRQAENYLQSGLTVGDIATRLGFCDQNYFSTVFKKHCGSTPSEYVAQYKYNSN